MKLPYYDIALPVSMKLPYYDIALPVSMKLPYYDIALPVAMKLPYYDIALPVAMKLPYYDKVLSQDSNGTIFNETSFMVRFFILSCKISDLFSTNTFGLKQSEVLTITATAPNGHLSANLSQMTTINLQACSRKVLTNTSSTDFNDNC